jgi:hypothetical protein
MNKAAFFSKALADGGVILFENTDRPVLEMWFF